MKKYRPALVLLISFVVIIFSCKKINEATTLGGNLVPPVDNVNTFDTTLTVVSINGRFNDSVRVGYNDPVALGDFNDPEFGHVHANFAFSVSPPTPIGNYPFAFKRDSAVHPIDSVVLSLAFSGAYGDTLGNGIQTVTVQEIDPGANFRSDTSYRYNDPASDFSGSTVGTKTFKISDLNKDTSYVKEPGNTDTTLSKYTKVLRIKLNNSVGFKIANFDTSSTGVNGGFSSDSAFKKLFPGLAIKASNSGNALSYFDLKSANTKLIIYYKYKYRNNVDTVGATTFTHSGFGQANYVNVQAGGNWASSINNTSADKVYLASSPSGAYASLIIPGLSTFPNKIIHRAEIIATNISAPTPFSAPSRLFLARNNLANPDTTFLFQNDIPTSNLDYSLDPTAFGGTLRSGEYRFNISRYVQGVVTRHEPNDTLKLYSPFYTFVYNPFYRLVGPNGGYQLVSLQSRIMEGRVVLGGGNYAIPTARLRLRIVYSNL